MRIDKFLWSVRIFKTRSQATDACRKGHVTIDEQPVKPARSIAEGETFGVRKNQVNYTYRVKALLKSRVGAKLVENYIEDLTPEDELLKLEFQRLHHFVKRDRGAGRPTKKERRDMENFLGKK